MLWPAGLLVALSSVIHAADKNACSQAFQSLAAAKSRHQQAIHEAVSKGGREGCWAAQRKADRALPDDSSSCRGLHVSDLPTETRDLIRSCLDDGSEDPECFVEPELAVTAYREIRRTIRSMMRMKCQVTPPAHPSGLASEAERDERLEPLDFGRSKPAEPHGKGCSPRLAQEPLGPVR